MTSARSAPGRPANGFRRRTLSPSVMACRIGLRPPRNCRPNATSSTCFPILPGRGCTSAIRKVTPPRTSSPDTGAPKGSMCCTRSVGTPSGFRPSNTPSRPANTPASPPKPTSPRSGVRLNRLALATTGNAKWTLPIPGISAGPSGYSCSSIMRGSTPNPTARNPLILSPARPN